MATPARTFVWRPAPGEPYQAYSTNQWFEPPPDDPNCFWRGAGYPEALKQAKEANRVARTASEAFQRKTVGQPLKRPNAHELAALHALAEANCQPAHKDTRGNLVKYGWASASGDQIATTREGRMVVYLSLLVLPDAVLAEAFPEGVPMGTESAASRLACLSQNIRSDEEVS